MELETFREKKKKTQNIIRVSIFIIILMIGMVIYRSYAIYEERQEYNVIEGKIQNFISDYDIKVTTYLDGKITNEIPSPNSGKAIVDINCDQNAKGMWDYQNWTLVLKNMTKAKTKCQIYFATQYTESILNGADPALKDDLIPVIIENDGSVKKANIQQEWYSYEKKDWANAVILEDKSITYQDGEKIPETNIESYFVWIPRYRYQIFSEGNYKSLTGTLVENHLPSRSQKIE